MVNLETDTEQSCDVPGHPRAAARRPGVGGADKTLSLAGPTS